MKVEQSLIERSGNQCELCANTEGLSVMEVAPSDGSADQSVLSVVNAQLCWITQNRTLIIGDV